MWTCCLVVFWITPSTILTIWSISSSRLYFRLSEASIFSLKQCIVVASIFPAGITMIWSIRSVMMSIHACSAGLTISDANLVSHVAFPFFILLIDSKHVLDLLQQNCSYAMHTLSCHDNVFVAFSDLHTYSKHTMIILYSRRTNSVLTSVDHFFFLCSLKHITFLIVFPTNVCHSSHYPLFKKKMKSRRFANRRNEIFQMWKGRYQNRRI